jgi:hypothetical protein
MLAQQVTEDALEDLGQCPDRHEEGLLGREPFVGIQTDPSCWDKAVYVGMVG